MAASQRRCAAVVFAAMIAVQSSLVPTLAFAQAPDAKTSLANGDKAARAKDWTGALKEYEAANKAAPSAEALEGMANAYVQLKRDGEAYAAYDEYLKTYGAKVPAAKKAAAEARLKELAARTGALALENVEAGAAVAIDDAPYGTTPLAGPIRLSAGPHRVRITKEGFVPFDQAPNITAGATTSLPVKLEAATTKGRLSVREKNDKPIRVLVDGVDMGDAPWSGEVEAGAHDVGGRGGALVAAPEKVTVERGKTREVELVASSSSATLKISTNDGKGLVYIDGKLVGEGTFSADVPAGQHTIKITREGYDPFEETIDLKDKETLSRSVTLTLVSKIETGPLQKEARPLEGLYGGFGLMPVFQPGGASSSMQRSCESATKPAELSACDSGWGGAGGGLNGFIGYHWDPVGIELFGGGQYDHSGNTLSWAASSVDPGIGPDPARTEAFDLHRIGAFGAARIRVTFQGEKLRFTFAAGVGLAFKAMILTRESQVIANSAIRNVHVPDGQSYLSPLVSLEPTMHYRLGPHTSVGLGLAILIESPNSFNQIPTTPQDGSLRLGPSGHTTPPYEMARGPQVFVGPTIGMMFGP
ncbi:MAG: PEGA domain-containing protein [Labilithrix sp.]|nr:PEGA domain-containing protein [Labilithrix sp.]